MRIYSMFYFVLCIFLFSCASIEEKVAQEGQLQASLKDYKSGLYFKSLKGFKDTLKKEPQNIRALEGAAKASIKLGQYQEAIHLLERRLSLRRPCASCYADLGDAYRAFGASSKAITAYEAAFDRSYRAPRVWKGLSWAFYKTGEHQKGFKVIDRFYSRSSFDVDAAVIRIRHLFKLKHYGEALKACDYALGKVQRSDLKSQFYSFKGDIAMKYLQFEKAKNFYLEAISIQPLLGSALLGLGKYYFIKKDSDSARVYLTRALRVSRELAEGYYFMGRLYEKEDKAKAIVFYRKFSEKARGQLEFKTLLSEAQKRLEEMQAHRSLSGEGRQL